jgi:hypothetical protein
LGLRIEGVLHYPIADHQLEGLRTILSSNFAKPDLMLQLGKSNAHTQLEAKLNLEKDLETKSID